MSDCDLNGLNQSEWFKSWNAVCFRILRNGILLQTQRDIDQVVFTYCMLRNLILEADGLDIRWEKPLEWDKLNPQTSNSDEGYREDGTVDVSDNCVQERRILERVPNYVRAVDVVYDGNKIEVL
jgi:hypothetical protein